MQLTYYIGLHVQNRNISSGVKDSGGKLHSEGWIPAMRFDLDRWKKIQPRQSATTLKVARAHKLSWQCGRSQNQSWLRRKQAS